MGLWLALFASLVVLPHPAEAGFFDGLKRFFSSVPAEANESVTAAVSFPLLGSQPSPAAGIGGAVEDPTGLSLTQDSALVAQRNPAGTLIEDIYDQILIYTVAPGDTPGTIAERFGISLNTLLWANQIQNPNVIKIGDELLILPVSGVRYEVKKGDTIESVARKLKGDSLEILGFNRLAIGEPLVVGTVLIIPDGELPPPTPSTVVGIPRSSALLPEYQGYYLRPLVGGRRSRGLHGLNGIDLAQTCGSPVLASAAGRVLVSRSSGWNGGYGRYLVLTHPNNTQTLYAHLSSVLAAAGNAVSQGTQIGAVGSTGNSTGCHLHFEVRGAKNPF